MPDLPTGTVTMAFSNSAASTTTEVGLCDDTTDLCLHGMFGG